MANTCAELARRLLGLCLKGEQWPDELLRKLISAQCCDTFFRIVVEGLADLFEPRLCETYAALLSQALGEPSLVARYHRIRAARRFTGDPAAVRRVFVLSRVTLGADIAITSVMLEAAKERFPDAEIFLAGGMKSWELFAADSRIGHLPVSYLRSGALEQRCRPAHDLKPLLSEPGSIVIDPDSRITQLGLLPVCSEETYWFFESRAYGGESDAPLPVLAERWVRETFGVERAAPYIAPHLAEFRSERPLVSISFGAGDNPAKRIADPFEAELPAELSRRGLFLCMDAGAGGEEAARVEKAVRGIGGKQAQIWRGSFAGFASIIARSDLYIGYDSAGQHAAAAAGTPLISIFAGFASPRMFARWRPSGKARAEVIRVDDPSPKKLLASVLELVEAFDFTR